MLEAAQIRAGRWQALSREQDAPAIEVLHQGAALADLQIEGEAGHWQISVPIPADLLEDGVQSFIVRDTHSGAQLDRFSIVTGQPLDGDLRVEIELLRAELDILSKAFRRHCVDIRG